MSQFRSSFILLKHKKERHGVDGQNKHNWYPAQPKTKEETKKELRQETKEQEKAKDQDKSKKHHKNHHKRHHNRKTMKLEDNTKPKRK